jgi:hypothetical protein
LLVEVVGVAVPALMMSCAYMRVEVVSAAWLAAGQMLLIIAAHAPFDDMYLHHIYSSMRTHTQ